ncbi:hypothetical protein MKX03_001016, partial [Papaver bracteatum]
MDPLMLYGPLRNKNIFKALIAAEYTGVDIEVVKNFEWRVTNNTLEFLKMNPIGKIPVLETPDGPVFESNAIARYVAHLKEGNPLLGSSLIEYVRHMFLFFSIASLKRSLTAVNSYLASNTYLVGHCVTLADIIMVCNLFMGFSHLLTKSFTKEFPHVERYFWTMVNQPNVVKLFGEVKQTDSVPPVQSAKVPAQPKEAVKPKAKSEPKHDYSQPKAEEVPEQDEAPNTMILDEWKRLYSNTKTNFREVVKVGHPHYNLLEYTWFCPV